MYTIISFGPTEFKVTYQKRQHSYHQRVSKKKQIEETRFLCQLILRDAAFEKNSLKTLLIPTSVILLFTEHKRQPWCQKKCADRYQ
jgi:hypothetical protein